MKTVSKKLALEISAARSGVSDALLQAGREQSRLDQLEAERRGLRTKPQTGKALAEAQKHHATLKSRYEKLTSRRKKLLARLDHLRQTVDFSSSNFRGRRQLVGCETELGHVESALPELERRIFSCKLAVESEFRQLHPVAPVVFDHDAPLPARFAPRAPGT